MIETGSFDHFYYRIYELYQEYKNQEIAIKEAQGALDKNFEGELQYNQYHSSTVYGYGIEGIRDKGQEPDQYTSFFPIVPLWSKFDRSFTD